LAKKDTLTPISRAAFFRIYTIDKLIRSGIYPNVPQLAEKIEVKPRTIERDIEYMRDLLGAPIKYCYKNKGYYYEDADFCLPPVRLTEGELIALFLGQKLLSRCAGTPYEPQIRTAFSKVCSFLPEGISVDFGAFDRWISFDMEPLRGDEKKLLEDYRKVLAAIENKETLHINYYTASRGQSGWRSIDPYHLRYFHGAWYIIAYCHWRDEVRIFALDRVRKIKETGIQFRPRPDFSLREYLGECFGIERGDQPQRVVIRFDRQQARWVQERVWHPSQQVEHLPDGSLQLEFTVSGLGEVKRWILGFGRHARVIAPPALREEIAREIAAMGKQYQCPGK
jgi:predicted DNA-binding transcriptional regulator YafY